MSLSVGSPNPTPQGHAHTLASQLTPPRPETHRHVPKVQAAGTAFRSRTPQGPRNTLLWPRHGRHRWLSPRRKTTRTPLCLSSLTLRSRAQPALPSSGAPQPCPGQGRRSWEPGASSPLECSLSLDPRRSHSGRHAEPESPVTLPRSPGPCPPSGTSPKWNSTWKTIRQTCREGLAGLESGRQGSVAFRPGA